MVPQKSDFLTGQWRLTLVIFLASVTSFTAHLLLQAKTARRPGDKICPCAGGRRRSDAALENRRSPSRRQGEWAAASHRSAGCQREFSQPGQLQATAKSQLSYGEHEIFILESVFLSGCVKYMRTHDGV